jgi:CBS domain-containing protein
VVIDRANQLLGIVGERDIMRSIAAHGARTLEMTAEQVMTRTPQLTHPATTVAEAMTMMTIGRSRHLPVMDHDVLVRPDQHWRPGEGPHHGEGERGR